MDTQSYVAIVCLHFERLRTLLDEIISELTTLEQGLKANGKPLSAFMTQFEGIEQRSAHLATEISRLQGFVQSLIAENMPTAEIAT